MSLVEESSSVFAVVVHLPPGYHQYKFIVDGKWRHDETAPFMPDPLGNVNNWLFVRRVDSNAGVNQAAAPSLDAAQQQMATNKGSSSVPHPALSLSIQQQQVQQQQSMSITNSNNQSLALALQQQQRQLLQQQQAQQLQQQHQAAAVAAQQQQQQQQLLQQLQVATGDVDMTNADTQPPPTPIAASPAAPVVIHNPKEPEFTRKKISDFLHSHTAYELIPESGKVVVLDIDLPIRQAFHALHEQDTASAPLWDTSIHNVSGVISASDFISILRRLRNSVSSGANPLSEAEMDTHTIRMLREQSIHIDGRGPKPLVYVKPQDRLNSVVEVLFRHKCSMAPVFTENPNDLNAEIPAVLHLATISGVLACLMRHFRASLASLPLLAQPLSSLPLGTWSPDAAAAHADFAAAIEAKDSHPHAQRWKRVQVLHTVTLATPLTSALAVLLDAGVSALPVVDEHRSLIDVYARSDITQLCRGNAYNRLQWEDVTVGQALSLGGTRQAVPWSVAGSGGGGHAATTTMTMTTSTGTPLGGLAAELAAAANSASTSSAAAAAAAAAAARNNVMSRVHTCTKTDSLRTVVERLSIPGVRRLIVVQPETMRVEGIISLSDVAAYLFL
eukprot:CAMPEP_0175046128 /NCGR_PEP_ID=MMETSP0052_2-20121109/4848_1 /TAXON_ID=51329 ORGANISM="Polytomella parva, Strain SAG 63-3" /NCGR_SAMPLE_ID=MMETSP0052_2 /ASSEMBLY_ACC=CAM_ASM_000194 /LENGTH=614 /DNA_ID=CAMNT_0016309819 /DNA_START=1556 /DNA_END=3400 /DNA_ORIENTATION=-